MSFLLLLAGPARANPPRAVLLAQASTDPVSLSYGNLYAAIKSSLVTASRSGWVEFGDGSFTPTLVHFPHRIIHNPPARDRVLEPPVLVLMPGDTVAVLHNTDRNTFQFRGRHQAELDFCVRLWRGALSLDGALNAYA